ncbi:helix-turn-helix transcriptional regulator [Atopobium sp. oral taxon 810]|uniref:helix-turn-helix transcriptional regulator n=1 Tax=Atopobium sp. oral taxon 810 TaxID=712158 RepID=UPI0003969ED3|nr:helix-turn-helix transcriptional regulator [Atopobium sp. oral taxon 810]ERI05423.1 DNA-binding helix-turn-helix protein [Atopobium sp. oral taxon 810 str. F0209]
MELGNLIRKHRTAADMSQDDLAQAIFVSRQTVSNWETGRTCPDVQSLLLMSNLFETSIDELVKGDLEMIESQLSKDAKAMKALGRVVAASLLFAIVAPALGLNLWDWQLTPTAVIFVMGRGIGMATAVGIEVIKRRHNIDTYRDISDFMQERAPEGSERKEDRTRESLALSRWTCARSWGPQLAQASSSPLPH